MLGGVEVIVLIAANHRSKPVDVDRHGLGRFAELVRRRPSTWSFVSVPRTLLAEPSLKLESSFATMP